MIALVHKPKGARMKRFEERVTVNAPADKVFDLVSNFTRHGEWSGHRLEVTPEKDGPVAVGSVFNTSAHQFGTQREKSTVTDLEAGETFGWGRNGALGEGHHRVALRPGGGA